MHEAALSRAAQPVPVVVLGMLLRPLSVGHVLQFSRDEILLGVVHGSLDPSQVTAAVLICCQSWEQSCGIEHDRFLALKLWIWKRRVFRAARAHVKRKAAGLESGNYFATEAAKFNEYLREGATEFEVSEFRGPESNTRTRSPGSPWILRLQQWLMTHLRLTEQQAWDYPYGLAKMRWACHWEQEGGINIKNDSEGEFERYAAEQDALAASK